MDDIGTRLDKAAELGGFKSRRKMAEALGVPYSTMNQWITRGKITEKGAVQISSKIPISQTYLLTGEGEAESSENDAAQPHHPSCPASTVTIPVLSATASAGGGNNIESIDIYESGQTLAVDRELFNGVPIEKISGIKVDGYSMVPVLLPGSWVFFKEGTTWEGDGLYVLVFRNVLMVKIVEANPENGNLRIRSANPDYETWEYDPTEDQSTFKIVGRVVRVMM